MINTDENIIDFDLACERDLVNPIPQGCIDNQVALGYVTQLVTSLEKLSFFKLCKNMERA